MGLGDALDRLDRRVLGKHAGRGVPLKRPVRFGVLLMLATGLSHSLVRLATGFTLWEAVEAFLMFAIGAAISTPFLVWFHRRRAERGGGPRG